MEVPQTGGGSPFQQTMPQTGGGMPMGADLGMPAPIQAMGPNVNLPNQNLPKRSRSRGLADMLSTMS
jgi:hypothetical protein